MELNDCHYSLFELRINLFEPTSYWSPDPDWEEGRICALCGEIYRKHDDLFDHLRLIHNEWFIAEWATLKQCESLKKLRVTKNEKIRYFFKKNIKDFSRPILKMSDVFVQEYQNRFEINERECSIEYTCKVCGQSYRHKHAAARHVEICKRKHIRKPKVIRRTYLKPWQDKESLFCSPKLKEIIKKEPLLGDECR